MCAPRQSVSSCIRTTSGVFSYQWHWEIWENGNFYQFQLRLAGLHGFGCTQGSWSNYNLSFTGGGLILFMPATLFETFLWRTKCVTDPNLNSNLKYCKSFRVPLRIRTVRHHGLFWVQGGERVARECSEFHRTIVPFSRGFWGRRNRGRLLI